MTQTMDCYSLDYLNSDDFSSLHKYKIWVNNDDKWCTYLPDATKPNNRRLIRRNTEEKLMSTLRDYYQKNWFIKDLTTYKELRCEPVMPGRYLISCMGDIYDTYTKSYVEKKLMQANENGFYKGQYYVDLENLNGSTGVYRLSWVVAHTFIGAPPEDMEKPSVDHIDGDSTNNFYRNLRWLEQDINSSIRKHRGTGIENSKNKLSMNDVIHICNMLVRGESNLNQIAKKYEVDPSTIRAIYCGKSWTFITRLYEFSDCYRRKKKDETSA